MEAISPETMMTAAASIRVAILEPDSSHAAVISGALHSARMGTLEFHAADAADDHGDGDAAVVRVGAIAGNVDTSVRHIVEANENRPLIVLACAHESDGAIAAIRAGAADCVLMQGDWMAGLNLAVQKNLELRRLARDQHDAHRQLGLRLQQVHIKNRELEESVKHLSLMAATDPLTDLANRRALMRDMTRSFADAERNGYDMACLMIDLDGFKQFNDGMGHPTGDLLLCRLAEVLKASSRRSDVAGRFGGDEFAVVLPRAAEATARRVARRIQSGFDMAASDLHAKGGRAIRTSLSIGLACLSHGHCSNADQLLANADAALYRAKALGKSRIEVFHASEPRHSIVVKPVPFKPAKTA